MALRHASLFPHSRPVGRECSSPANALPPTPGFDIGRIDPVLLRLLAMQSRQNCALAPLGLSRKMTPALTGDCSSQLKQSFGLAEEPAEGFFKREADDLQNLSNFIDGRCSLIFARAATRRKRNNRRYLQFQCGKPIAPVGVEQYQPVSAPPPPTSRTTWTPPSRRQGAPDAPSPYTAALPTRPGMATATSLAQMATRSRWAHTAALPAPFPTAPPRRVSWGLQ